jgi:rod shape-determining protein MreD
VTLLDALKAEAHPEVALVLVVAIALLRGPLFGACAGFWTGLVLDTASFETLGLTSLLLTIAGYWCGRFGEVTTRASAHPPLIAVALATLGVGFGSALVHFMLGSTVPASEFFAGLLLPSLALNMLLAYPAARPGAARGGECECLAPAGSLRCSFPPPRASRSLTALRPRWRSGSPS